MSKKIRTEAVDQLFEAILCLKDKEECYTFFEDVCTINELLSLSQRFEVAKMLMDKRTYLDISEKTGASTPDPINICLLLSCKTGKFYFLLYFYNLSRFCFSHCFLHYQHGSFHYHSCSYLKFLCNFCCFYSQIHSFLPLLFSS